MGRPLETLQQMRPNEEARPEPIVRERGSPCIPSQITLHGVLERIQHLFNKQAPVPTTEHEPMQASSQEELEAGETCVSRGWRSAVIDAGMMYGQISPLRAVASACTENGKSERP